MSECPFFAFLLINELFVAQRLKTNWEDLSMWMQHCLGIGPEVSLQNKSVPLCISELFGDFFSGFLLILWDQDGVSLCYWDKIKG